MGSAGNGTLERIQQEIKDVYEREKELKNKYANSDLKENKPLTNGIKRQISNGSIKSNTSSSNVSSQRIFIPNMKTKGVMQKFLKMKGRMSLPTLKPHSSNFWSDDPILEPPRVTTENGKPSRNGYVSAEEKMRKELQEFQKREEELRNERRKSQPDLMALLESKIETEKPITLARSMSQLCSDDFDNYAPILKPAKSLADLCDTSEDSLETPGTGSLINKFESLKH